MGIKCIKDESNVDKLLENLAIIQDLKIQIGIMSNAGGKMLTIARVHEFGCTIEVTEKMRKYLRHIGIYLKKDTNTINIPERSFIRAGFDENKSNIESRVSTLINSLMHNQIDRETFYEFIGEYTVGLIQEYLTNLSSPPLHPATVKNKKSSNPLVDTGHLRDTITYKIVRN